jgi:putative inorganic carbon (HCO3(-)) transporter
MRAKCFLIFDTILFYSLCGLIFAIPISKAGIEIFFSLSLIFFIAKKTTRPDFKFFNDRVYIFLSLFLCFSAFSLINSAPYMALSQKALFFKWLKNIMIFIMAQDVLTTKKRIHYAFFIFLVTSIFVGLDGIIQRGLGYDLLWRHSLMRLNSGVLAITATLTHYNSLGAYLLFPIALVLAFLIQKETKISSRVGFYLLAILLAICLLLTFSRGAWLGFFGLLFFMLLVTKQVRTAAISLFFFLGIMLLMPFARDRFLAIFLSHGDSNRFIFWKSCWMMIKENPLLGKGVGTFMQRFSHYAPGIYVSYAHNSFLQIWAETGLFSLLSFLSFLWILFSRGVKAFRANNDIYLLGVLCGLFGFLVHTFFDNQLYTLHLSALFWSMAGILSASARNYGAQPG